MWGVTPFGIIYSWYIYLARIVQSKQSWRDRASVAAMIVITVVAGLWFPALAYLKSKYVTASGLNWQVYDTLLQIAQPVFWALILSSLLAIIGRPRLIAPLLGAVIGTACWWLSPFITK